MRARDQSSIFSTGRKFRPDYGLLLELHALTLVARSYALLGELSLPRLSHFSKLILAQCLETQNKRLVDGRRQTGGLQNEQKLVPARTLSETQEGKRKHAFECLALI